MPLTRFNYYVEGRAFEWIMSISMCIVAVEVFIWPQMGNSTTFKFLREAVSADLLAFVLLFVGGVRCIGLMLNGHTVGLLKIGPWIRAIGSVISAMMWAQFALSLLHLSVQQEFPLPGVTFWTMFTLGELYVAYTTVKNA